MSDKKIPRIIPAITLNNAVLYPYLIMPIIVVEESMKKVVDYALNNDKIVGVFLAKNETNFHDFGTAASIIKMVRNNDGTISLLLQGISRIKIANTLQTKPYILTEVEQVASDTNITPKVKALQNITLDLLEKMVDESNDVTKELINGLKTIEQPSRIADIIAGNSPISIEQKQMLLEEVNLEKRYEKIIEFISKLIRQMKVEKAIRNNLQLEMDVNQRRYFLMEQLSAIKKELGMDDENSQEISKWQQLIEENKLPEEVKKVALDELSRIAVMSPESSEYSVIRNYLDWIVNLPWNKYSEDRINLEKIERILNKDHYGLEKPKQRILEFMAVKKLKKKQKGPILCFVGPPGVGKTSIGRSVARAINRKFIRISLGGLHDESEIRGHRRTYIGAMPGKIINEIKKAGTANPVFMLDEIDKLGRDFRGDPASALLELLDPEQNYSFTDNYLNLPFDLSEVMFITTANSLDTIPMPLRDRMEIIEFSSYLEEEKVKISQQYLIPKETENNGLTGKNIKFMKSGITEIIRYYVREAGVRNLQRTIGTVCRKVAYKVAEGDDSLHVIKDKNVADYLGVRKFSHEMANRKPEVGVVTGLAWTMFGGEILFCEATAMIGKGQLILTGRLGEVMKESARIAISYIKSNLGKLELTQEMFEKTDLHIHLPAGAVPKDGPSAGVTLTTALTSLLTNRKVRHDVAMTGEITLLGKVLPIGGVREKILAAKRAGIKEVILPKENEDDFSEIPEEIRHGMVAHFVTTVEEVLKIVLI